MEKKEEEFGRRWHFRDPAKVYEIKEAATCKGCAHEEEHNIFGKLMKLCGKRRAYGKKCTLYRETN